MTEPFSLLAESWIPVLRADGSREMVRPAAITSGIDENPIVAPAWGRADFDAATREFWIGLLATACGVRAGGEDGDGWEEWFRKPPTPDELDDAFAPLASAFVLDGEGPRFGQDLEEIAGESVPVSQLLIEAPGANTVKRNLDHFVRRGRVETLSRAGAAMALFTLQTYAPSGGAGHRVSVRGGGPLTTLLMPGPLRGEGRDMPVPLWRTLWLATPGRDEGPRIERVFPWLVPSRVSDKGKTTTGQDVDESQAFWGMPRRIRLIFEANELGRLCDLTGRADPLVVRAYRTRPHGTSYVNFVHPLSPHYRTKPGEPLLPLHGQPGGIGYRHWVGLVANDVPDSEAEKSVRQAAKAVTVGRDRLFNLGGTAGKGTRLIAAGFDMDNMKARAFVESEMPLHLGGGPAFEAYDRIVRPLVSGAAQAEGILRRQLREALSIDNGGPIELSRADFRDRTEIAFRDMLAELANALTTSGADEQKVALATTRAWLGQLRRTASEIFATLASTTEGFDLHDQDAALRRIKAESGLQWAFKGYGKHGNALFDALKLATPKVTKQRSKAG